MHTQTCIHIIVLPASFPPLSHHQPSAACLIKYRTNTHMQPAALRGKKKTADTAKSFLLLLLKLNYGESKLIWWVVSWTQTLHACNDRSLSSHCCRVAKCVMLLTVHKALPAYHSSFSSDGYQSLTDYGRHFKKLLPDEKKNSICAAAISPCHHIKKWLMRIFGIAASFIEGRQNALLAKWQFSEDTVTYMYN